MSQEDYQIEEIEKLRDDRLELYEEKTKIICAITELEKSRKGLESKEKSINAELLETEDEIADFQKEKMAKLNQLDVAVVLKIKQIQNLERDEDRVSHWLQIKQQEIAARQQAILDSNQDVGDDERYQMIEEEKAMLEQEEDYRGFFLPKSLHDSVLFTRTQLLQLIDRKRELDEEIVSLSKEQKEAHATTRQKLKEIKENEKIRNQKKMEFEERQMLRFGNIVDLDSLEVSGPSAVVLELRNKFAKTEQRCIKDIEEAESKFQKTQRMLTADIQSNTGLLNLIRSLGEEQLRLNGQLDNTNKAIFDDEDDKDKEKIEHDKNELKRKLEENAQKIDVLKTEINLYKRKGGHIYTKVTTNRRVAHLNDQ